jgi:tetratricopeptide (TPR) repeat protein
MKLLPQPSCRLALYFAIIATTGAAAAHANYATAEVERPESQQEYWAQIDGRDWDAAAVAAEKLVAAAREKAREKPLGLAEALSLLGDAQLGKKDYAAAEASYSEALKLVEQHAGTMSSNLLAPLSGMGYTLARSGQPDKAVPYLDRALVISHRSYGLFDLGQQTLLRQLAASLTQLNRQPEAERHMLYLQRVGERAYGRRDPRLVPTLLTVGDWYALVGDFMRARITYRAAMDIVERKLGPNDLALVEPLRHLALSYTQEITYSTLGLPTGRGSVPTDADGTSNEFKSMNPRYIDSDGEKALERALKILDTHPEAAHKVVAETLVQTGDWFQIKAQSDKALTYYRRAAALAMPADDAKPADAQTPAAAPGLLSFPVRVYYPTPLLATRNAQLPADQVDEKYVQVEFTVTNVGYVANAKVTDQNGTARQASEFLQAIRASRYRPKFVNGEPVATPGVTSREVFKVRKVTEEKES